MVKIMDFYLTVVQIRGEKLFLGDLHCKNISKISYLRRHLAFVVWLWKRIKIQNIDYFCRMTPSRRGSDHSVSPPWVQP